MADTLPSEGQPVKSESPFGPFLLRRRLGSGGMAETFLAERRARTSETQGALTPFGRAVCLKLIRPEYSDDPAFRGWFFDEARIHAHLHHDNIVQVYDFGELDGRAYLVLEYVEGCDLRELMRWLRAVGGLLPLRLVVTIAHELASALDCAHRLVIAGQPQHLVHRDVSPHNVLLSMHGHSKLCDFGVVKARDRVMRTETGGTKGKVPYMSPEQLSSPATVDARTDLFALGVVLFELVTGQHPFRPSGDEADMDVARRICAGARPRVLDLATQAPPQLASIVEQLLEPDADRRPASAAEVMRALEEIAGGPTASTTRELARYVRAVASGEEPTSATLASLEGSAAATSPRKARRGARARGPSRGALVVLAAAMLLASAVGAALLTRAHSGDLGATHREEPGRAPPALPPSPVLPALTSVTEESKPADLPLAPAPTESSAAVSARSRSAARLDRARATSSASPSDDRAQPPDAWLDISVEPDGRTWRVWVDGQYHGTADVKVKVPAGKHRVAVGHEEPKRERSVHVKSQSTRSLLFKTP